MTTHLSLMQLEVLRAKAVAMVESAFARLTELHVIPCPRFHPYLRVGRDYYGMDIMTLSAFREFEETLTEFFPTRFVPTTTGGFPPEYPNRYGFDLLEASVAALTQFDEEYVATSATVEQKIVDLAEMLQQDNRSVICARAVTHMTTNAGEVLQLGDIIVHPSKHLAMDEIFLNLIPGATSAYNRQRPHVFARPESVVATTVTGVSDVFALQQQAHVRLNRFILATRLLTGCTSQNAFQIYGQVASVPTLGPDLNLFEHSDIQLGVRPAVLSQPDALAIQHILDLLDSVKYIDDKNVVSSLQMAIEKFTQAFGSNGWSEDILDLATALEAAISGSESTDIVLRLSMRASLLLATDTDPQDDLFLDVKLLYDLRSRLVHGTSLAIKELTRLLGRLSVSRPGAPPGMQIALAVDRLRDIVRRAILARVVFAAEDLWPLHRTPQVSIDWCLADPARAKCWRVFWQTKLGSAGAEVAARAATKLADSLMDDYPGKNV
jgi:hypothetical protein